MELKSKQAHQTGKCRVKACAVDTIAVADGKSFFSNRSKDVELCEGHLGDAQDMAEEQGKELFWKEYKAPAPAPAPTQLMKPGQVEAAVKKQIETAATEGEETLAQIKEFEITSKEDMDFAVEVLTDSKKKAKQIDGKRQEITKPLNEALRAVNALFKPALNFLAQCEREVKQKIAAAHAQSQIDARQALAEAGTAAATGDGTAVTTALEAHETAEGFSEVDGVQYRTVWKYEIKDESLIPREFLMPDNQRIQNVVMHKKGDAVIPGVRVYEEKVIASVATKNKGTDAPQN